jgi:hypothetical protein
MAQTAELQWQRLHHFRLFAGHSAHRCPLSVTSTHRGLINPVHYVLGLQYFIYTSGLPFTRATALVIEYNAYSMPLLNLVYYYFTSVASLVVLLPANAFPRSCTGGHTWQYTPT